MEKSLKKRPSSRSRSNQAFVSNQARVLKGADSTCLTAVAAFICGAAVCFSGLSAHAVANKSGAPAKKPEAAVSQTETFKNLIEKAQNLSLQRDRLQASQILVRALAREPKTSAGFKDGSRALDELMTAFYTERAQSVFAAAEANLPLKTKEAIDGFTEALRLEDGNVTILKALARTHLTQGDCDRAEPFIKSAEVLDPYAPELLLLRLQVLDCSKSSLISAKLAPLDPLLLPLEKWTKAIQIREAIKNEDLKKAKTITDEWIKIAPDYPEGHYWKWSLSGDGTKDDPKSDRASAQRYVQICQNLTPRKRKSYNLDVDLCKGRQAVDAFLKETQVER